VVPAPRPRLAAANVAIIRARFGQRFPIAMNIAFVFPGQGSQSVGMLAALAADAPILRATFDEASAVLGYDLWKLAQEGPEERLNSTECTQPAMLAAGVGTWRLWRQRGGPEPARVSGHSLGEFTALVCADALELPAAIALVRFRGQIMQEAAPLGTGAMAAILAAMQDAAVNFRMKRFHPAIEHFRKARQLRDVLHRNAGIAEKFGGTSGRN